MLFGETVAEWLFTYLLFQLIHKMWLVVPCLLVQTDASYFLVFLVYQLWKLVGCYCWKKETKPFIFLYFVFFSMSSWNLSKKSSFPKWRQLKRKRSCFSYSSNYMADSSTINNNQTCQFDFTYCHPFSHIYILYILYYILYNIIYYIICIIY